MWFPHAFWPALFAVILGATILIRLFLSDIRKPGNLAAFMLFFSFFIWSFGEMMERMAGPPPADEWMAWFGAQFLFIGMALAPAAFVHFSVVFPYMLRFRWRKAIIYFFYGISLVFAILGIANPNGLIIADMEPYEGLGQTIWGIVGSGIYTMYVVYIFSMALVFTAVMIYKYFKSDMKVVRMQIFVGISGFIVAVTLITVSSFIPMLMGESAYPLTTVSFSIFSLFILYAIYRYRVFLVSPEEHSGTVEPGFEVMDREAAYRRLKRAIKDDVPILAFISGDVASFKKSVGKDIPAFQISRELGPDHLNPLMDEHVEMIRFIIASFAERTDGSLVFADVRDAMKDMDALSIYEELLKEFRGMSPSLKILFIIAE